MHNLFSLPRFMRLFRKHTAEHWKSYLMGAGVLAGALLLVLSFLTYVNGGAPNVRAQAAFFAMFLLGAGFLFTSSIFADLSTKPRAIAMLSLPASHLEKYMVVWLYSFFFFLIAYTGIFYAVDELVLAFADRDGQHPKLLNLFSQDEKAYLAFLLFAVVHGLALWGAVFFEKLAFIKTATVFFLGLALISFLNYQLLNTWLGDSLRMSVPLMGANLLENNVYYHLELPSIQQNWVGLALFTFSVLFWLAAYARLREKQL